MTPFVEACKLSYRLLGASLNLAAMRAGIPTIIVAIGRPLRQVTFVFEHTVLTNPFFSFWGRQIHKVGIAARAISSDALNCEAIVSALEEALSLRVQSAAKEYGSQLSIEDGTKRAAEAIHKHLPLLSMR